MRLRIISGSVCLFVRPFVFQQFTSSWRVVFCFGELLSTITFFLDYFSTRRLKCHRNRVVMANIVKVKLLSNNARLPTKGTVGSIGWDLFSSKTQTILPWSRDMVPTDLAFEFPVGTYGQLMSRSGLCVRHAIDVCGGILDNDFRGHAQIIVFNASETPFVVDKGMRVAQLLIKTYQPYDMVICDELLPTTRGYGGFGSTGLD